MSAGIYRSAEGRSEVERRYREFLARWPVPAEHLRIPTSAGETFVVVCGKPGAPPLVLLHGAGLNSLAWLGDVAAWSEHFRVYAVDMIGEPGLSAPSRPPLASDAYARWLDEVLDGLAVTRPSVVGLSLGGWLALDYATRRPERVERLALLCPGGIGRQKWGAVLLSVLLLPFGRWGRRVGMNFVLGRSSSLRDPRLREFAEYVLLVQRSYRPRREPLPVLGDAALAALSIPVAITVGGRDALIDSADTRRRAAAIPHATVHYLPQAGHVLPTRTEPILEFLRSEPGRA